MNRISTFVTATVLAATAAAGVAAAPLGINLGFQFNNQYQQQSGIGIRFQAPQIRNVVRMACPDLSIETAQATNADGSIRVTIRVANYSGVDFVSNPGQQQLKVNGHNGGASGNQDFWYLGNGETLAWTDTFHPFEFPATYEARVVYDPDILLDGNPHNDDCRASNNYGSLTTDH